MTQNDKFSNFLKRYLNFRANKINYHEIALLKKPIHEKKKKREYFPNSTMDFSFLRLFLRMQNGSYGLSGDLKPSFLHSFSRSDVNKRPLTDDWQTYM